MNTLTTDNAKMKEIYGVDLKDHTKVPAAALNFLKDEAEQGNCDEFDLSTGYTVYIVRDKGFVVVFQFVPAVGYKLLAAAPDLEVYEDNDEAAPVEQAAPEAAAKVDWMHGSDNAIAVYGGGLYVVTDDSDRRNHYKWHRMDNTPALRDYEHYKRVWKRWVVSAEYTARGTGYATLLDALKAAEAHALRPAVTDSTLLSGREVAERVQRDGHTLLELQVFGVEHRRTFVVTPDPSGHGTRNEITNAAFDEAVRGLELHLTRSQYGEPTETYTLYRYTNTEKKGRGRR